MASNSKKVTKKPSVSNKGHAGTRKVRHIFKKGELKFMTHDSAWKNGQTHEKIRDAALIKLQSALPQGLHIVKSIRTMTKTLPAEPMLNSSSVGTLGSEEQKRDNRRLKKKYEIDYRKWIGVRREFEENFSKVYGILSIRDNPIEPLAEIEKQMHVHMRAAYPTLTMIKTLASFLSIKQGKKEGLLTYLEQFKSEVNVDTVI